MKSSISRIWTKLPTILAGQFKSQLRPEASATAGRNVAKKSLPKPPVPDLDACLNRYLEFAKVVAEGQRRPVNATIKAVDEFRKTGEVFQKQLLQIANSSENWVNLFWLPEMYLRVRLPLPINSSPAYIFPQQKFENIDDQLRYAALLVRGICEFKDKIDRKEIEREVSTGKEKVKMCMEQYDRILSCYREPRHPQDFQFYKRLHGEMDQNEHIAVMCMNQAYIVRTRIAGELLPFSEILYQLKEVVRMASNRPVEVTVPVGAGSAGNRERAAKFWAEMKNVPQNVVSLEWMRTATFVVCIDRVVDPQRFVDDREANLVIRGKHLLHGFGSRNAGLNRWYDATIQLVVANDGTNGFTIEHSTAEGIVIISMAESALRFARQQPKKLLTEARRQLSPKPLTWFVSKEAEKLLEEQRDEFDKLATSLDLEVLIFGDYGKEFIKGCRVSPDGFVQLVMQLAHYRVHGYLVSTYESAAIRRFRSGRVDNIRSNHPEALNFVKTMENPQSTKEQKISAFRRAAEKQAELIAENITGQGIDNHLCALNVLAREAQERGEINEIPELFTDPLWTDLMRFPLSTSQVTTSPDISDTYLCYGAVVPDGYGCAYNIQADQIIFAPSAFKDHPRTDLKAFKTALRSSLLDMQKLLRGN